MSRKDIDAAAALALALALAAPAPAPAPVPPAPPEPPARARMIIVHPPTMYVMPSRPVPIFRYQAPWRASCPSGG